MLNVLDEFQLWFILHFDDYLKHIKGIIYYLKPSKVITYGASSGGFAALLFGELLGADLSIALSPQVIAFYHYMNQYRIEMSANYNLIFNPFCYLNRVFLNNNNNNNSTNYLLYASKGNKQDMFHVDFFEKNFCKNKDKLNIKKLDAGDNHNLFSVFGNQKMREMILSDMKKYHLFF